MSEDYGRKWKAQGPTVRDWFLFLIGFVFVALGLFVWIMGARDGWAYFLIFLLTAALSSWRLIYKLRQGRRIFDRSAIVGGVEIGFDLKMLGALCGGVLLIGFAVVFGFGSAPIWLRAIGFFLIVVGAGVPLGLAFDWIPRQSLRFDPDGVVFRQNRFRVFVPWADITELGRSAIVNNPLILIRVSDCDALIVDPPNSRRKARRLFAQNQSFYGADLSIMTRMFGLDDQLLVAAMDRYIREPEAREQLAPAPRIEGR